jgi:hypothetical protein
MTKKPRRRITSGISARAEGEGFEPSSDPKARNGFRDRRIRPLCHPSRPTRGGVRGGEGGIRTLEGGMNPLNALAGRCLQPLGHFSEQRAPRIANYRRPKSPFRGMESATPEMQDRHAGFPLILPATAGPDCGKQEGPFLFPLLRFAHARGRAFGAPLVGSLGCSVSLAVVCTTPFGAVPAECLEPAGFDYSVQELLGSRLLRVR